MFSQILYFRERKIYEVFIASKRFFALKCSKKSFIYFKTGLVDW